MLNNKTILITGGTGSFGRKCVSILLKKHNPKKIIIYSRDELKQWEMSQFFNKYEKKLRFFIGDVRDLERVKLATKNVDYIIHAAALKHVPAAEYNPQECIKTNVNGAENIITASITNKVKKVIALSTDKAVSPVNLYGASKLAADKLFISANNLVGANEPTRFSIVRYGNVIGSRGSVLPFFKKHLKEKKNYFPITNKEMTRFWISLDQGVKFVLHTFSIAKGGEIFIPKMPSIKIIDLAKSLNNKFKLKIIGIRPGEKIHESLCIKEESNHTYEFKNYFMISPSISFYKFKVSTQNGKKVKKDFEYNSGNNKDFLNLKKIKKLLD